MKVVQRGDQAVDHLESILCFAQGIAGTPDQGQFPVIEECLQQLTQRELSGLPIHKRQQDGPEVALQCCTPLQVCQHLGGIGITTQLHQHPHSIAVAFIADVGDAADLAVVDRFSQFFNPARFAQLIGKFRHHNGIAFVTAFPWLHLFDVGNPSHRDAAASDQVGVA